MRGRCRSRCESHRPRPSPHRPAATHQETTRSIRDSARVWAVEPHKVRTVRVHQADEGESPADSPPRPRARPIRRPPRPLCIERQHDLLIGTIGFGGEHRDFARVDGAAHQTRRSPGSGAGEAVSAGIEALAGTLRSGDSLVTVLQADRESAVPRTRTTVARFLMPITGTRAARGLQFPSPHAPDILQRVGDDLHDGLRVVYIGHVACVYEHLPPVR